MLRAVMYVPFPVLYKIRVQAFAGCTVMEKRSTITRARRKPFVCFFIIYFTKFSKACCLIAVALFPSQHFGCDKSYFSCAAK